MQSEVDRFCRKLSDCEHCELRMIFEYFKDDIIYVLESLPTHAFLCESQNYMELNIEHYRCVERQLGQSAFAQILVEDVLAMKKEAVIGFLTTLCALQKDHRHPNLLGVINQLNTDDQLLAQILQDTIESTVPREQGEIWGLHKQHLLDKTRVLVENKPPGTTSKQRGFPISERYLDLIVVSGDQFHRLSRHEILYTGGRHEHHWRSAKLFLERVGIDKLFRWCHRSGRRPRAVMVSGVPGVGKTTMMQKLVFDWVNGKLYQRFHFVFFFKFRELNGHAEDLTLEEMILEEYPHLAGQLGPILEDPEKLLFIFDGLDESLHPVDFGSGRLCQDARRRAKLGSIVAGLVKGSLLEGCCVLMTSRPTKLAEVDAGAFQRVSEIMGFFPAERERYFFNFFGGDRKRAERAFQYVRENGTLYTFCYIPAYCWIVCTVLSMSFGSRPPPPSLPKTVTQLFVAFVANLLANHSQVASKGRAKEQLRSMGLMAEHGVMGHILTFDRRELNSFHLHSAGHLLSSFMVESKESSGVAYSFFHLTVQEFLAALAHFVDPSAERLRSSIARAESFQDGRGELFLRFLVGLSHGATRSLLAEYLNPPASGASRQVVAWLHKSFSSLGSVAAGGSDDDKRKLLNAFTYLYESQNDGLAEDFLKSATSFDFSEFYLTPLDCTVLTFALRRSQKMDLLDLDSSFIQSEGLERLGPVLHTVGELRLSNNDLKDDDVRIIDEALQRPDCRIRKLSLRKNALTDDSSPWLAGAIGGNTTLRELDLSRNNLAGSNLLQLLTAVSQSRITNLLLQQVKLTDEYSEHLPVLGRSADLRHLDLSLNYLTDAGAGSIAALTSSKTLRVRIDTNEFSREVEENLLKMRIE